MRSPGNRRAMLALGAGRARRALASSGCDLQEDADTERGEQLFTQKCGSCHALTAAGTNADVGPNLDLAFEAARASGMDQDTIEGVVESQIENPRPASPEDVEVYMPANLVERRGRRRRRRLRRQRRRACPGIKPPSSSRPSSSPPTAAAATP